MKVQLRYFLIHIFLLTAIQAISQQDTVTVGPGETFETIAVRYGVTMNELLLANPGKAQCYAGMRIAVPQPKNSPIGRSGLSSELVQLSDSLLVLAKAKSSIGEYKKAIKLYDKVIDMSVRRAYGLAGRGECYYALKKYKAAKADLTDAIYSGQLAEIEKSWCKDALEDVENGLQQKREKRNRVWGNIGLAVASAAAMAATAYMVSEQSKAQNSYNQAYTGNSGIGYAHLDRADAIIAQSQMRVDQIMAQGNAQLQQMTQQTMIQAQQAKQHIEEVNREQLQWSFEFNEKNGRYPTEAESDMWLYNNHRDIWMLNMQAKTERSGGADSTEEDNEKEEYKGELSPDQYEAAYRRYESRVQDWYGNLTSGGIKVKDDKENIKGKTDGEMKGHIYMGNQAGLKHAQNEMRKIRTEAAKYGVHIVQSKWETATVRY